MTQTQTATNAFEGLSPREVAEKISAEGGQEGLVFATMVIAIRAMQATKGKDDGLCCDIAKNLFSFMKSSAVEHFIGSFVKRCIGSFVKRCTKDESFREPWLSWARRRVKKRESTPMC